MRKLLMAAGVLAAVGLAGCEQKSATTTTTTTTEAAAPAEAPKKSLARQATFYQGQEPVQSVKSATVTVKDGTLSMTAQAETATAGWTRPTFVRRIYAGAPADGIYEVDVVAEKPAAPGAAVVTPVTVKGDWPQYPDGRLKGVRFMAKDNDVVAMLPAGAPAAAK